MPYRPETSELVPIRVPSRLALHSHVDYQQAERPSAIRTLRIYSEHSAFLLRYSLLWTHSHQYTGHFHLNLLTMATRLAACEVCRKSKLACDHKWPTCSRCEKSNKSGICIYRVAPFKRKRQANPTSPGASKRTHLSGDLSSSFHSSPNVYPNPGFLGSSSHATIFEHISSDQPTAAGARCSPGLAPLELSSPRLADDGCLIRGADVLRQLLNAFPLTAMCDLVMFWLAKGANLALAEPFVEGLATSIAGSFSLLSQDPDWHVAFARRLLRNSAQPLEITSSTSISDFIAQTVGNNLRWEALGLFFSAVSRATYDIPFFPRLYMTREEQAALRQLCTRLSDSSLEIALSLDCLNDLQLVLQYENFIIHSYVDGAQSKAAPSHAVRETSNSFSKVITLGANSAMSCLQCLPLGITRTPRLRQGLLLFL